MYRFQFSLRQLLVAVGVTAALLVIVRFAFRSHALAVGLLACAVGAAVLLAMNLMLYGFLRAFGAVISAEPERSEDITDSLPSEGRGLSPP